MVVLPEHSTEVDADKLAETLNKVATVLNALAVHGQRVGNRAMWGKVTDAQGSILQAWAKERGL